ncbi:MAG: DUF2953 domain-containing protein [Lachnospiraceae bacterium]|nr:DUF2953 domain-containing protein [Lachnospiraceae bacterium]
MLHIILLILKIIGIVLLCILGILILAIVCALFVPVRYRIRLTGEEGEDKPPFMAYVKITWLLHLVNIVVCYPADVILRVRLMFITLFKLPQNEKTDKKEAGKAKKTETQPKEHKEERKVQNEEPKEEKKEQSGEQVQQVETPSYEDIPQTHIDTSVPQKNISESRVNDEYVAFESDFTQIDDSLDQEQEADSEEAEENLRTKEKNSLISKIKEIIDKIKQIVEKIKAFFENIQYTIRKFCDKIKSMLDNIEYYQQVIESETFKHSLQLCKKELKSLYKGVKPDKFEAEITIGMEDPAATGKILAIYGMLYPFIGQNVQIVGDFERTHIEGDIYIRGRIRAFTFLRIAIRVYFNKDIKKLIKLLKKEAV